MTGSLGEFQDAFLDAVWHGTGQGLERLTEQSAFAVYRNTIVNGCVDALCDNFPSVERLVGHAWMRSVAADFARRTPPRDVRLVRYGTEFPDYLESLEASQAYPYLGDVARLDRDWLDAFSAPDEAKLEVTSLVGMTASDLASCVLRPRASTCWRWSDTQPIYNLWRHSREGLQWPQVMPWCGEGALMVGNLEGVTHQSLSKGGCAFLTACADGCDLDRASARALQAQPDLDFTHLLDCLLRVGAFRPIERLGVTCHEPR